MVPADHPESTGACLVGTPRSRLARLALEAATALPEVAAGVRGRQRVWATADAGEILEGVVATARPDARFDVELHLVAQWPFGSLFALADQVRTRVRRAAARVDLEGILGSITVGFEDVDDRTSRDGGSE
jgi:hypothetical protein